MRLPAALVAALVVPAAASAVHWQAPLAPMPAPDDYLTPKVVAEPHALVNVSLYVMSRCPDAVRRDESSRY